MHSEIILIDKKKISPKDESPTKIERIIQVTLTWLRLPKNPCKHSSGTHLVSKIEQQKIKSNLKSNNQTSCEQIIFLAYVRIQI